MDIRIPFGIPIESDLNNFIEVKILKALSDLYTNLIGTISKVNDDSTVNINVSSRKLDISNVKYQIIGNSDTQIIISPKVGDMVLCVFTKDEFLSTDKEELEYIDAENTFDATNLVGFYFFPKKSQLINAKYLNKEGIINKTEKIAIVNNNGDEIIKTLIDLTTNLINLASDLGNSITTGVGNPIANAPAYTQISTNLTNIKNILQKFELGIS